MLVGRRGELVVDFADSATAFEAETARLRDGDWAAEVRGVRGAAHPAWYTLWRRLSELEIHHVDLDAGDCPRTGPPISPVSACRGQPPASPAPTPPRRCCARQTTVASTASGRQARNQPSRSPATYALLAWLLGRSDGSGLSATPTGPPPPVPPW